MGLDIKAATPTEQSQRLALERRLWDGLPEGLVVIDSANVIRYANPALGQLFGHDPATLPGQSLALLQPERLRHRHAQGMERFLQTGQRALQWSPMEITGLHADGREFPVQLSLFELGRDEDGLRLLGGILRDGAEASRGSAMQVALHRISEAAHSAADLSDLFRRIHAIVGDLMPARNFFVALHDGASDLVSFPYWIDEFDPVPDTQRLADRRGLTDVVLRSGEPLLLSPEMSDLRALVGDMADVIGTDGVDWLGIPLKTARGTIGVLTVQSYSGGVRYTETHKQLLQFVSDQVAAAVERKQAQQFLLQSEQRFRSVFDHSPMMICLLSYPEGLFQEMNAAAVESFGWTREEALGRSSLELDVWVDPAERRRYLELLQAQGSVRNFEARMRRRNGEHFTVLYSGSLVRLGDRDFSLNSLQDISERRRAEDWQRHYADALAMITAEAPRTEVLDFLARFAERQAEGLLCSVLLVSPDGRRLVHGAAPSLPEFYTAAVDGAEIGPTAGTCGVTAFTGQAFSVEDLTTHPNWEAWRGIAGRAGLRACWSHPILSAGGQVLGTFAVYRPEPGLPGEAERELIERSAGLAAIALERAQHQEDRRLAKVVFEQSLEGIMVTDPDNRVLMVNRAFERLTGYTGAELIGKQPAILDAARDLEPARTARVETLARLGRWSGEAWGRKRDGASYPLALSVAAVADAAGVVTHYISILADVSDQKIQAARIEQLAFYDSLTGLPNRALFLDRLEQTLANCRRQGNQGAILFLDLDRFKEINDSLGHAVGDLALVEVARRFQRVSRKEETLARLGGDEFVLIAENADHQTAVRIASRLQRVLVEPLELMGQLFTVGASIGIAFYPADGDTSGDLIKRTDIAMYQAKASGGGYRLYQAEMGAELEKKLTIAKRLGKAMEAGELSLNYQPQIDLATGRVIGAEALLRWTDPVLGFVSPGEFIPIAEERGMMGPLGDWVMRQACAQVNAWAAQGARLDGRLAINVSAVQMEDPDIVGRLLEIVHDAGLAPDRFELELTESSMMADPERAVEVMELLGAAGFGLSVDDFGTGYSSLAYLKRFSADQIKIDISFVRNMLTDADDHAIVATIIAMARSLGLQTTAEGVEEVGQAEALLALGCNFAQGYHFGRPEPAQAFMARWLLPAVDPPGPAP